MTTEGPRIGCPAPRGMLLSVCPTSRCAKCSMRKAECSQGLANLPRPGHGFCFRYPPIYKRVPNTVKVRNLVTFRRSDADASLFVEFDDKPFDLQSFVAAAPTG